MFRPIIKCKCVGERMRERIKLKVSLYVRDDGRVECCEKENGCFVLYQAKKGVK
jgi:hypothetical protein